MTTSIPTNDSSRRMVNRYLPRHLRVASVLVSLLDAMGSEHDAVRDHIRDIANQVLVSRAPSWRLAWFEEELGLSIGTSLTDEERRSRIYARMRAGMRPTSYNLRVIANSYPNGDIEPIMDPDNWWMTIRFISRTGRPSNIGDLQSELRRVIDAHVGITYEYRYLLRGEWRERGLAATRGAVKLAGRTRGEVQTMRPEELP